MFKVNDKVVCICDFPFWYSEKDGSKQAGPKLNEDLTVDFIDDTGSLGFLKYDPIEGYDPNEFRKLDYDFAEEVLNNVIKQPQLV